MIRFLSILLLISSFTSCKKVAENIQEKKVLDFITAGQWKVTNFTKTSTDYTTDFTGYQFQFKTDNSVDAFKNSILQKTGTWQGDATTLTITSNFPADAAYPLPLLNGVWKITDGGNDFVVATKTENGETSSLRLEKV